MGGAAVTLYAQWTLIPTYSVTYNGNTSTGGSVPTDGATYANGATVTVLGNTGSLLKTGYTFNGWNTLANGGGTAQAAASTFTMGGAAVTLYAQWTTAAVNGACATIAATAFMPVSGLCT
ncbi:MAG: InlB B-repeat-containing protein, partial [Rhodoferax sp.]